MNYTILSGQLSKQLHKIEIDQKNALCMAKHSMQAILEALTVVKQHVKANSFKDNEEEIMFFKQVKPIFSSLLVYYTKLLRIETYRPIGKNKRLRRYLIRELDKLKDFSEKNREFYNYYLSGDTSMDKQCFTRSAYDPTIEIHEFILERDPEFSTNRCSILAILTANDLLQVYLQKELVQANLENKQPLLIGKPSSVKLTWTGQKAALIELMYALQTAGVFNDAHADIKQIAAVFESVFHIELGEYYRTYQSIRIRKKNRTSFLDNIKEQLLQRMDDADDRVI